MPPLVHPHSHGSVHFQQLSNTWTEAKPRYTELTGPNDQSMQLLVHHVVSQNVTLDCDYL